MIKPNPKKAKIYLDKIRQLVAQKKSPFHGLSEEQVIARLRKTREELWEKKLAAHT